MCKHSLLLYGLNSSNPPNICSENSSGTIFLTVEDKNINFQCVNAPEFDAVREGVPSAKRVSRSPKGCRVSRPTWEIAAVCLRP